jgi:SPP1 gp7 family putative phage head morphogenesis protein
MTILNDIERFRADTLAQDRQRLAALARAYGELYRQLEQRINRLLDRIAQAQAAGIDVRPTWLVELDETRQLLAEAELLFGTVFAREALAIVTTAQQQAVAQAQAHAVQLIGVMRPLVTPRRLNTDAFTDLVGALSDGTPLQRLLAQFGPDAAAAIRDALIASVGRGEGSAVIQRQIRSALGGSLTRAMRIARTEPFRALRSASLRSYRANADLVEGWVWVASLSPRTCPVCWALHGRVFSLDTPFASHVMCRCSPAPKLRGVASPVPISGPQAFARQPAAVQQQILGPAKYRAYVAGEVTLADLVGEDTHPQWGPYRYERSARSLGVIA